MKTKSGVLFFALTVLFLCTAHSSRGTSHAEHFIALHKALEAAPDTMPYVGQTTLETFTKPSYDDRRLADLGGKVPNYRTTLFGKSEILGKMPT